MSTIRRRISQILLLVTLLSLLPQASVSAVPRTSTAPAATALPQAAPLPLDSAGAAAMAAPAAAPSGTTSVHPEWDLEHFPMFNPVLAKPFVVGPTWQDTYTRARTVAGPNNTLHSVFYRTAIGDKPAGWYYSSSPHIEDGLPDPTAALPAARVSALSLPINEIEINAAIAVDEGGGVHIVWPERYILKYKYCSANCLTDSAWNTTATTIIDKTFEQCNLYSPSIIAWGSGETRRVVVAVQKQSMSQPRSILVRSSVNGIWSMTATAPLEVKQSTSTLNANYRAPSLARAADNQAHLIWYQTHGSLVGTGTTDPQTGLRYALIAATGTSASAPVWIANAPVDSPAQVVDMGSGDTGAFIDSYGLTVDASGKLHVAWPEWTGAGPDGKVQRLKWRTCAATCTTAASWSTTVDLGDAITARDTADNGTIHHTVALAAVPGASDGRVYAVWRQLNDPTNPTQVRVIFAVWHPERGWLGSFIVTEAPYEYTPGFSSANDIRNIDLNIGANNDPALTWMRFRITADCSPATCDNQYWTEYVPLGIPDDQQAGPCECDQAALLQGWQGTVNTASGSLSLQAADMAVPSAGPPLALERTYTSLLAADPAVGDSPFGRGWRHAFEPRLTTDPYVTTFEEPSGNRLRFRRTDGKPALGVRGAKNSSYNIVRTAAGRSYSFDSQGRVTYSDDGKNHSLSYGYTPEGLLTSVTDESSQRTLTFSYTPAAIGGMRRVSAVSDGFGRQISYTYTPQGLLHTATTLRGGTITYTYTTDGLLHTVTDPLGVTQLTNTYVNGKIATQTDAKGLVTTYATVEAGPNRTTTVSTPRPGGGAEIRVDGYRRDGTPRFIQRNGAIVGYTAFKGTTVPAFRVDANGVAQRTQGNLRGMPTSMTNALGGVATATYNGEDMPTQVVANGLTSSMAYGTQRTLTENSILGGGLSLTRRFTYTNELRLEQERAPDGSVTKYEYSAKGEVNKIIVGLGTPLAVTTVYTRNPLGRITDMTVGLGTPQAQTTHTDYAPDGQVTKVIQNYRGTGVYNAQFPDRNLTTTYGYDTLGRRIWEQRPDGRYYGVTSYDTLGRVRWVVENPVNAQGVPTLPTLSATAPMPTYLATQPDANVGVAYGYNDLGLTTLVTQTGILTGTFSPASQRFTGTTIRVTRTEYDDQSRPVTVTQNYRPELPVGAFPDVNVQTITRYDAAGNVILQRDPLGRWTKIEYDALNRPVTTTVNYAALPLPTIPGAEPQDFNVVSVTRYDAKNRVERTIENYVNGEFLPTEPLTDRITLFGYDGLNRTIAITTNASLTVPAGRTDLNQVTRTHYDPANGRALATRDVLGTWTFTEYDALGRATATVRNCRDASGLPVPTGCAPFNAAYPDRNVRTSVTYDKLSRVFEQRDPLEQVTRTVYDSLGRTTATIVNYQANVPASATVNVTSQTGYNALSQVVTSTNALGRSTIMGYDGLGRPTTTTDPDQRTSVVGYDGTGAQRWSRTPDGRYTVTLVDGLGRPVQTVVNYQDGLVTAQDGVDRDLIQTTRYDAAGRSVASVDPLGRETRFLYTLRDQLRAVQENVQASCASNATDCNLTTWYSYDRAGNQQWLIDARGNRQRISAYDAADRMTSQTDALGQTTGWTYDAAGQILTKDDPRGPSYDVTYQYDALGRRISTTATQLSGPITEQYNARGQRTKLTDATGVTDFERDPLGRIKSVTATSGVVGYEYNALGQRTQLRYPTGTVLDYSYTPGGQLDTVLQGANLLADYGYDAAGRLSSLSRANGATTAYRYDNADRLRQLDTTVSGAPRHRLTYTLNRRGQRIQLEEATGAGTATPPTATPTATSVPPTATATATATATNTPTATATATPGAETLVIRINSGSYADATFSGVLWKADQYATGGGTNNATAITDIAGTADDTLYRQTRRSTADLGGFSYAIPVPASATYRVRLHFAETYWGATGGGAGGAGKRVFSANLEGGATELANYDINADVGPMTAVVKEFTLPVTDGTLSIDFSASVNRPIISAIEVFQVPAGGATATSVPPTATATSVPPTATATSVPPTATATPGAETLVIRINSGSYADATYSGVLWKTDQYATGGGTNNATAITDIAGTADDTLYRQTRRSTADLGTFSYAIPVPASATYRVRLHFAETYWGATGGGAGGAGKRVFSANLEGGATELANYDINADVGPMTAVVKEFTLPVTDGTLSIDFSASVNRPIISAIEVFQVAAGGAVSGKAGLSAPLRQTNPLTYTDFTYTDYDYDGVGRLIFEETNSGATTVNWANYGYDKNGNRTYVDHKGVISTLSYNAANQRQGWQYDAAGNPQVAGSTRYYDALNRLTRVNAQDKVEFHYNGDGVLTRRNWLDNDYDPYNITTFVNDLAAPLSQALVVQAPQLTTEAWYGLDRLASHTDASTTNKWYLPDGVGTARGTLDDAGNLNRPTQYDAWGIAAPDPNDQHYPFENPYADPFGYTGEYTDPTSGLVYLRARWYDPASGTLLGRDPFAGYQQTPYSMHDYQYGYSDPVSMTDPSGRNPCETIDQAREVIDDATPPPLDHTMIAVTGAGIAASATCHLIEEAVTDFQDIMDGAPELQGCGLMATAGNLDLVGSCTEDQINLFFHILNNPRTWKWFSRAIDFSPGLGDFKGVVEAFTGCDIITGEPLGNYRWLGLIGLGEYGKIGRYIGGGGPEDFLKGWSARATSSTPIFGHTNDIVSEVKALAYKHNSVVTRKNRANMTTLLELSDGTWIYGISGGSRAASHLAQLAPSKKAKHINNFGCSEVTCLLEALQTQGVKLKGARLTNAEIRGSSSAPQLSFKDPCAPVIKTRNTIGCENLVQKYGITVVPWK